MGIEQDWDEATPDLTGEWEAASPKPAAKAKTSFWDEYPNAQTAMRYGLPLAAGVATMPFTGGMSLPMILATEGLASLGAESVNQAIGVNEPSALEAGYAIAAPMAGRFVGNAMAAVPKLFPGVSDSIKAAMAPESRDLVSKLLPGGSSKALYEQLETLGPSTHRISVFPRTQAAVDELQKGADNIPWGQLQTKIKANGLEDLYTQINASLRGTGPTTKKVAPTVGGKSLASGLPAQSVTVPGKPAGLTFEEGRTATEGLRRIIDGTTDKIERGAYQKIRGAMLDDMEHAPMPLSGNTQTMQLWKEARQAAKMENARFHLGQATERAIIEKDGVEVFNPNHVVKWLRTNDEIKKRVTPSEYRAIVNEYRMMASSAGHNMSKFTAMLIGGFASGGAGGALAGYLTAEQLSKAMMSETGRKAVRKLVNDPSRSNFRRFMMLGGSELGAAQQPQGDDEE